MLYHATCKSLVQIKTRVELLIQPSVVFEGTLARSVTFLPDQDEPKFFCTQCQEAVEREEVVAECCHCFKPFELEHLIVLKSHGGLHCADSIARFEADELGPFESVSDLIGRLNLEIL